MLMRASLRPTADHHRVRTALMHPASDPRFWEDLARHVLPEPFRLP